MKDLCAPSSNNICALQRLDSERNSAMAVFERQVVLLDGKLVPGNLEGTETVREAVISSGEVFCSGGGADSCFVCLSWFLSAVDLSVVVAHRLEWCLPLQRLHRAFDLHWATLW